MKLISSEECQALRLQFGRYKIPVVKKQKSFRIRSASKLKNSSNNESEEKKQQPIFLKNVQNNTRSSSLKSIAIRKIQIKKLNTHVDQSDEEKLIFQRVLKTQQDNFDKKQNKKKQKLKQLAQIFNIKTIMKMKNKKSQCDSESIIKQDKKKHLKGNFRINKYVAQQKQGKSYNDFQSQQYWKKVNQSLILAENQANLEQPSKDLRQICQKLNFQ